MSRWAHPRVGPRSDEELFGWETAHLLMSGGISSNESTIDLTENEEQRERRLRREALKRRRPVGFAPWPEDA